jgi:hypothetical protein
LCERRQSQLVRSVISRLHGRSVLNVAPQCPRILGCSCILCLPKNCMCMPHHPGRAIRADPSRALPPHRSHKGQPAFELLTELPRSDVFSAAKLIHRTEVTEQRYRFFPVVLANSDVIGRLRVASHSSIAVRTCNCGARRRLFELISEPRGAPAGDSCALPPNRRPSALGQTAKAYSR